VRLARGARDTDNPPRRDRRGYQEEATVQVQHAIVPPPASTLRCMARGIAELPRLLVRWPALAHLPRGAGEPVLVLPGFGFGDTSTWMLRAYLRRLGYDARGWGLGMNAGHVPSLLPAVVRLVEALSNERRQRVRLIGWSLGGYLGRDAARERPELVSSVIMLGSPVVGGPKYTVAAGLLRRRGVDLDAIEAEVAVRNRRPLPVPIISVFSRTDGVVAWEACVDVTSARAENIEVRASHVGLGFSPDVYAIIARQLSRHAAAGTAP
jgi:pimeloyl-ACP methyl ester carboxylesterase